MSEGFIGCISRVEFDDIYPLKLLFQQDKPENVKSLGGNIILHETLITITFGVYINFTLLCALTVV